ncbi:protease modulator HflC [Radiobacillus sp. PE A8.2]|uniref:protease modulator HflC n=1 Tax=Radiobacillus sp. PE A8.2 TaxID=3380349 RepID=UPI00388DA209
MSDENVYEMNQKSSNDIRKYIKIGISILILIVVIAFGINSMYIVKEGEYKVVRQFGEVIDYQSEPGLKFKVPLLHSVTTLPNKKMVYDITEREINTLDKKRLVIDNYAIWEITNPQDMISTARTEVGAESRMGEFIFSVVRSELGSMNYDEIINEEGSTRGNLNKRVTDRVNELLTRDNYGVQVDDVRIKRTDLPDENEQTVYNRMISERESTAQEYLSRGEAEKKRIIATTDRDVQEMLSKADAQAAQIRAEGETEAAEMYSQAFQRDTEFYQLYRTLESYKTTIDGETTIILPQDSDYTRLLLGYLE